MNIYQPSCITQAMRDAFLPTRLYIKKLAGYYYFGKTSLSDPINYSGSGKKWKNIIKKHGYRNIVTLWVSEWYYSPDEIQHIALHFSQENMIVESDIWANLRPENGLDGNTLGQYKGEKSPWFGKKGEDHPAYGRVDSGETRRKKALSKLGDNNPMRDPNVIQKVKETNKRIKRSAGENNPMYGKKGQDNPNFGQKRPGHSEKMKGRKQDPEVVARRAEKLRGIKCRTVKCPHCDVSGSERIMPRWHFARCKHNPETSLLRR
jgi:hypothetical protein